MTLQKCFCGSTTGRNNILRVFLFLLVLVIKDKQSAIKIAALINTIKSTSNFKVLFKREHHYLVCKNCQLQNVISHPFSVTLTNGFQLLSSRCAFPISRGKNCNSKLKIFVTKWHHNLTFPMPLPVKLIWKVCYGHLQRLVKKWPQRGQIPVYATT